MSAPMIRSTSRESLAEHAEPTDFRHRAACRSVDPEVFFPTAVAGGEFVRQVRVAKAVCAGCPVWEACLTWALSALPEGVAGGLTEYERRVEAARRRGARRPDRRRPRRPAGGSREEVAAAGRAALAAGMSVRAAAAEFLVSERTAGRWARAISVATSTSEGESAPATGAPSRISQNTNAWSAHDQRKDNR